jgi:uncharacterized protein YukE
MELMMLRLTNVQCSSKQELLDRLKAARAEFEVALEMYNTLLLAMTQSLTGKVDAFNEVVEEINEWKDSVHADLSDHFDSKSERWQNGDSGAEYSEWMEQFTGQMDTLSIELPEPIELDSIEQIEELEEIRNQV